MADIVVTANLLLAALLEAGGGRVVELRPQGSKHMATVDMAGFERDRVGVALTDAASAVFAGPADWELWFEQSFLDDVDHRYMKLKRTISNRRRNP